MSLWGGVLVEDLLEGALHEEQQWLVANAAFAIGFHASAFIISYFSFSRLPSPARVLVFLYSAAVLVVALNWIYLVVIPRHFLVEEDTATEKTDWPVACLAPHFRLVPYRYRSYPDRLHLSRRAEGRVWLSSGGAHPNPGVPEILDVATCEVTELPIPRIVMGATLSSVSTTEVGLYAVYWSHALYLQAHGEREVRDGVTIAYVVEPEGEPRRIELPIDVRRHPPILSTDGEWVGWVEKTGGSGGPPNKYRVQLRACRTGKIISLPLSDVGEGQYRLREIDMAAGEVTVTRNYSADFVTVDLDGTLVWGPMTVPPAVALRRVGRGWVRWHTDRNLTPKSISWALPKGTGSRRIPGGRAILSVDIDPSREFMAVSVGRTDNDESSPDWARASITQDIPTAVFVFRVRDGVELFRKYLRPGAEPVVQFIAPRYFAYGTHKWDKVVTVFRIPEAQLPSWTQ